MARFRVEIPDDAIAKLPRATFDRVHFALSWASIPGWCDSWPVPHRGVTIYDGDYPIGAITVLQALARGDDLDSPIERLGEPPHWWPPFTP